MTPKGSLVTNSLHLNLHNNDSTTIIDKKTLFGVHAQVSYIYIYIYILFCMDLYGFGVSGLVFWVSGLVFCVSGFAFVPFSLLQYYSSAIVCHQITVS